ncbi:putative membrane protein [Synechococcus sp. TAK9802]|nr:putative membrane protein [Synechococcus sp. TAK9802]
MKWILLLALAVIGAGTLMETTATSLIWPEQIGQELLIN